MKREERQTEPSWELLCGKEETYQIFSRLPVEYWPIDKSRSRPGETINVSESGLLLQLSEPMEVGLVMGLTLFLTSGPALEAIEALAQVEVVWQEPPAEKDEGYRVGVKLVDISPEDKDKWENLLNALKDAPCREGNPEP